MVVLACAGLATETSDVTPTEAMIAATEINGMRRSISPALDTNTSAPSPQPIRFASATTRRGEAEALGAALGPDLTTIKGAGQWLSVGVGVDPVHGLALTVDGLDSAEAQPR